MKRAIVTGIIAAMSIVSGLRAERIDLSSLSEKDLAIGKGVGSDGSALSFSTEQTHSGSRSLRLVYNIQASGYGEFIVDARHRGLPLFATDGLKVSFWVRGDASAEVGAVVIRFIDANGEVFQFPLKEIGRALRSSEWTRYETVIDLKRDKQVSWGPNVNGVVDTPFTWFGFAVNTGSKADAGTLYFDDIEFEAVPASP